MPKCPYYPGVRIKRAPRKKSPDKCFISARTRGDISVATKGSLIVTVSMPVMSSNLRTLCSL